MKNNISIYSITINNAIELYKQEKNLERLVFRSLKAELQYEHGEEKSKMVRLGFTITLQNALFQTDNIKFQQSDELIDKAIEKLISLGYVRNFERKEKNSRHSFSGSHTAQYLGFTPKAWDIAHKL